MSDDPARPDRPHHPHRLHHGPAPATPGSASPSGPAPRRRTVRRTAAAALALALAAGTLVAQSVAAAADTVPVGSGSYTTDPVGPTPEACPAVQADPRAYVTDDAPSTPLPTNDWWTSLAYKKLDCAWSAPLHAHPASYQPGPAGLGISYTTTPAISGTGAGVSEYHYPYVEDLVAGVTGLAAGHVAVDDWTDWTVTPIWDDGARALRATIGHGLPFAWFEATGGDAVLTASAAPDVWLSDGARLGLTVNGHDYVAFAPPGTSWTRSEIGRAHV